MARRRRPSYGRYRRRRTFRKRRFLRRRRPTKRFVKRTLKMKRLHTLPLHYGGHLLKIVVSRAEYVFTRNITRLQYNLHIAKGHLESLTPHVKKTIWRDICAQYVEHGIYKKRQLAKQAEVLHEATCGMPTNHGVHAIGSEGQISDIKTHSTHKKKMLGNFLKSVEKDALGMAQQSPMGQMMATAVSLA